MRAGQDWVGQATSDAPASTPTTPPDAGPTPTATGNATTGMTMPDWTPDSLVAVVEWTPTWASDAIQSIVVLVLAYLLGKLVVRLLGRRLARRFDRPSLTQTAIRGIRAGIFGLALLTIMGIYGYELSDITLQVTVLTAIVGVILAPIVGSIIGGVFLLADQPYEIGDMIELADNGKRGFVEDITLRYTKMFTLDNTFIVVPNGTMRERDVINYSAEDTRTRLSIGILITYESDLAEARERIERAARKVDVVIEGGPDIRVGAARYPARPTCYVDEFADHGILLTLRYWITEPYKLLAARSKVQTNVWEALADADVEIAYPHSHLYFDETSGQMDVAVSGGDASGSPIAHGVGPVGRPEGDGGQDAPEVGDGESAPDDEVSEADGASEADDEGT